MARREHPGQDPHTGVRLAHVEESPLRQVGRRVVLAAVVLAVCVGIIYVDRNGYRDGARPPRQAVPAAASRSRAASSRLSTLPAAETGMASMKTTSRSRL